MPIVVDDPDKIILFAIAAGVSVTVSSILMGFLVYPALQDIAKQLPAEPFALNTKYVQ